MKTLLIFLLPAFLFASLLNIDLESKNNNLANLYIDSVDPPNDSDEVPLDNTPPDLKFDPSGMFNERGYSNSNASSIDENEVINDFNGNLMYSFPMYNFKGPGDVNINVALSYNGAMSNTVNPATKYNFLQGNIIRTQNINAPGWIISVNGFACQTTNFETEFITKEPAPNDENIENSEVKMLQVGYQIPDKKGPFQEYSRFDIISILQGDGSILTLQNLDPQKKYGSYYSNTKKNYARAEVVELSPRGDRVIKLTTGDGLYYVFNEIKTAYSDYGIGEGAINEYNRPRSLYLESISDRYGNFIQIYYQNVFDWGATYGRYLLETINGSWDPNGTLIRFDYAGYGGPGKIRSFNNNKGNYEITTSLLDLIDPNGLRRSQVTNIKNPIGQQITIGYETYPRIYRNVQYDLPEPPTPVNLIFTFDAPNSGLRRMTSLTNYNGGRREYTYYEATDRDLDFSHLEGDAQVVRSDIDNFKGQGRDYFFNNMIKIKKCFDKGALTHYKQEDFNFPFTDVGTPYNDDPVDPADIYTSNRAITNQGGELYQTPGTIRFSKHYHNYPIYANDINLSVSDWPGEIKMYQENNDDGVGGANSQTIDYEFDDDYYNGYYPGSFLDTKITTTVNNISYEYNYEYTHFNNFPYSTSTNLRMVPNNPVQIKREIDPYGNVVETEYLGIYKVSSPAYYNGTYRTYMLADYYVNYYSYSQPLRIYNKNNNTIIFKQENTYNMTETNNTSYIGQILTSALINPSNSSDKQETNYKYYIKDTLGTFVYGGIDNIPGREGNLKETIDPNGNSSTYYYHPVTRNEFIDPGLPEHQEKEGNQETPEIDAPPLPQISYFRYNENSNAPEVVSSIWQDRRMPTRVDNNVNTGYALRTYNLYDVSGNIIRNVDNNLAVANLSYDPVNRIGTYTMPYDFNNSSSYDSTVYDTTFVPFNVTVSSIQWGFLDMITGDNVLVGDFQQLDARLKYWRFLSETHSQHLRPLIKFPNSIFLQNLYTIDSARLDFYTNSYITNINDQPSNNFNFVIIPYSVLNKNQGGLTATENTSAELVLPNLSPQIPGVNCSTFKKLDVRDLIQNHIINEQQQLQGITFEFKRDVDDPQASTLNFDILMSSCTPFRAPTLYLKGIKRYITERVIKVYQRATFRNVYDDPNNKVTSYTKIDNTAYPQRSKQVENYFDGFYKLSKTKQILPSTVNEFKTYYNYLDAKARTVDARNLETEFSYDFFGNTKKTENADNSDNLMNNTYQTGLTTGGYPAYYFESTSPMTGKFINKKKFIDENDKEYEQFTDALGNLIREVRYGTEGDPMLEAPTIVKLVTDYRYDSLYRVNAVKTPGSKLIKYTYDKFGRVNSRTTPDAGTVVSGYDRNGNMTYSRDANQTAAGANIYTFRTFDGLNRMKGLGITPPSGGQPNWDNLDFNTEYNNDQQDDPGDPYINHLTINVYDTLIASQYNFMTPPTGYYGTLNNTKGRIVVTAYRTLKTDAWSYKWYRYDARGRVIKMWNAIEGFDDKIFDYTYNSANMVWTTTYQFGETDFKKLANGYDNLARLANVDHWDPNNTPDADNPLGTPSDWVNLTSFTYTPNSQILNQNYRFTDGSIFEMLYEYNNRNWIINYGEDPRDDPGVGDGLFTYHLNYEPNGNILSQRVAGAYDNNFNNQEELITQYDYDPSNRLIRADFVSTQENDAYDLVNTYDNDGNLLGLIRRGSDGSVDDNFNYNYTSGTNKLTRVSGGSTQFLYDYNGNMTSDGFNNNGIIEYDHRNLITRITRVIISDNILEPNVTYVTLYKYDDAGNRIRKAIYMTVGDPMEPIGGGITDTPPVGWSLMRNEFYIRGVGGTVFAEYNSYDLEQYNLHAGADNFGKINPDQTINLYLKDHLGSIRAVIDNNNKPTVLSAQDYDAWGYLMENREFSSELSEYKFTSKERDNESNYDYFGARYYDARIARWGTTDPLFEKYISWNPYNYVLANPTKLIDPNGKDPVEIIIRAFIPFQSIAFGNIKGDNRSFSANLDESYRTLQVINIETDMNKSDKIIQSYGSDLGISIMGTTRNGQFYPAIADDGTGTFTYTAERTTYTDGSSEVNLILTAHATPGVLDEVVGEINPSIDYRVTVNIKQDAKGQITYNVGGWTNPFPAYEVIVIGQNQKAGLAKTSEMPYELQFPLLYDINKDISQEPLQNPTP